MAAILTLARESAGRNGKHKDFMDQMSVLAYDEASWVVLVGSRLPRILKLAPRDSVLLLFRLHCVSFSSGGFAPAMLCSTLVTVLLFAKKRLKIMNKKTNRGSGFRRFSVPLAVNGRQQADAV